MKLLESPKSALVVCFDLDDTLIETRSRYNLSFHRSAAYCIKALGNYVPLGSELIKRVEEIDTTLIPVMGYSPERFVTAWSMFYREICSEHGLHVQEQDLLELRKCSRAFQDGNYKRLPDVDHVLPKVSADRDVFIVTIGEAVLQRSKMIDSVIKNTFGTRYTTKSDLREDTHIFICENDKTVVLKNLVKRLQDRKVPSRVVMVGDSLKNDIASAKKAGAIAVHIPTPGHWKNDDADVLPNYTLKSIKDLPELLDSIEKEMLVG